MKTEPQANELWCPMVRFSSDEGGTFNRGRLDPLNDHPHNDGSLCNCIASRCAMWRWSGTTQYESRGYCGLAGKPGSAA